MHPRTLHQEVWQTVADCCLLLLVVTADVMAPIVRILSKVVRDLLTFLCKVLAACVRS